MKLLAALLFAVALPLHAQDAPDWFDQSLLDFGEDVAAASKDGKRVMLYFWLEGCPYCTRLVETTFKDPHIIARTRRGFVALALNVRGDREVTWTDGATMSEKQLAAYLKLRSTPTLVFLDEKGAIALRVSGYLAPADFERVLERARARAAKPG